MRHFPVYSLLALAALATLWGCTPAKNEPELQQEIQALKGEVQSIKEKMAELSTNQQKILEMLSSLTAAKPPISSSEPQYAEALPILSVSQILKEPQRFIGRRLTVRGEVGLVLLHRKSLYLKSPEGMLEVLFGNLRDKAAVDRLTSVDLKIPITVTGQLLPPSPQDPRRLQIAAEAVDF